MSFRSQRLVDWGDCDAAGIVFYPHYFRWADAAFHQMGQEFNIGHKQLPKLGVFATPLRQAQSNFQSPASYGMVLDIESQVSRLGETSFQMRYAFSTKGRAVAEIREDRVCVTQTEDGIAKTPIPDALRVVLQDLHE